MCVCIYCMCGCVCVLGCAQGCYGHDSTSGSSRPVPVWLSSAGSDVSCLFSSPPDTGNGAERDTGLSVCLVRHPSVTMCICDYVHLSSATLQVNIIFFLFCFKFIFWLDLDKPSWMKELTRHVGSSATISDLRVTHNIFLCTSLQTQSTIVQMHNPGL